ncbi:MAG: phosphomannomutase/phosphoglucomutase [Ottowia sp.]|nr:phosphomannomutase/phosphoglucomutase [Ottowia sp.]
MPISASIFKAYDIRGVVGNTLDEDVAKQIGQAFGSAMYALGETVCVVGRDGRLSSPSLSAALIEGLLSVGIQVMDVGMVTTPITYFATHIEIDQQSAKSCIMVTGSHNPPDYNGFKMVLAGDAIYGERIQMLYQRICTRPFDQMDQMQQGVCRTVDITDVYQQRIVSDIKLARPMKIAIDCGNGVAGAFAPNLFRALGCEVTPLFCEVDGHFPNHHPDPAHIENLKDLVRCLQQTDCELGIAFDGDGDRLGVVTKEGEIIFPDRQLMLFAQDVLQRHPGQSIIYDVKCTAKLAPWIEQHGGQALMWKTGHSLIKAKLKEMGAPLAGEMSGHLFFKDRWYGFDDGLYAGARLLEILSRSPTPSRVLNALPNAICTPELQMPCAEGEAFILLAYIQAHATFPLAHTIHTLDGIRVEYADGFGLARPSNTSPVLVMRFEADSETALKRIQADFKQALMAAKPGARLPF